MFSWKFTFVNLLLGLASVSWLAPSRLKATLLTLASVSLLFCVSEFCVRVISKKHCELELRGGEAWNDEFVLLVECLCWHGWLLLIVQFMTVDLCWHVWCWTLWFFNFISRIFKPKPGPIVWANVSNELCWLIVGNLCGFCLWVYFAWFFVFLFPPSLRPNPGIIPKWP